MPVRTDVGLNTNTTRWETRRLRPLCALALACVLSCGLGDGVGPGSGTEDDPGRRLTFLSYLWSPLEWSPEGDEIYLVPGRFAPDGQRHELLAIDVKTGVARILVGLCVKQEQRDASTVSILEAEPDRARSQNLAFAATTGGVAYIACGALHLIRDGRDTVIAPSARWVARTPDRTRLIYGVFEQAPCETPCYAIFVIDVATMETRQVPVTTWPIFPDPAAISPSGSELLAFAGGSPSQFARLSLTTGLWSETVRKDWDAGPVVGWNAKGIWILVGPSRDLLVDGVTGQVVAQLPDDTTAMLQSWTGGFVAPDDRTVALWSTGCTNMGTLNQPRQCYAARYTLWAHDLITHASVVVARGSAGAASPTGGDPYWRLFGHGSFSPDGRNMAYIMHGDVYIAARP